MRGHQPLIELRRRGMRPDLVSIATDPSPWRDWADWWEWTDVPQLEVPATDSIRLLDLRFLVGLNVMIAGLNGDRVRQLFAACVEAKAARVLAFEQRLNVERDCIESVAVHDSLATVEAA